MNISNTTAPTEQKKAEDNGMFYGIVIFICLKFINFQSHQSLFQ